MVEMVNRRKAPREPVYYGATLVCNKRASTFDCVVRNINEFGAKVEIAASFALPDAVDFAIERKHLVGKARLVWRDAKAAGLVFEAPLQQKDTTSSDWKRRLDAAERANKLLRNRLDQLTESSN